MIRSIQNSFLNINLSMIRIDSVMFVSSLTLIFAGLIILASASICPIVAVLALGVYVQWRVKKDNERATDEASDDVAKA